MVAFRPMLDPMRIARMPAVARAAMASLAVSTVVLAGGCAEEPNPGVTPPDNQLFFPAGLLLDPRQGEKGSNFLYVVNANSDLGFNSGSIVAIDLKAFFDRWFDEQLRTVYPYCDDEQGEEDGQSEDDGPREPFKCVLDAGSQTSDAYPCRRLALRPQVVECDEEQFVKERVRIGDFATFPAATQPGTDGSFRIFVPVRGDPSITYIDVDPAGSEADSPPVMSCDQQSEADPLRCGDEHRLTHLRNDEELAELDREPFNIVMTEDYAFVAHSQGGTLTLVDLDGIDESGKPAIVDAQGVFASQQGERPGGFGLAIRPCDVDGNAPTLTQACSRPLVYGSFRYAQLLSSFTADTLELPPHARRVDECRDPDNPCLERPNMASPDSCFSDVDGDGEPDRPEPPEEPESDDMDEDDSGPPQAFLGPYCASPADIGEACAVVCEAQLLGAVRFFPGGLFPPEGGAILGDIAFPEGSNGDVLYAVQTNPGALLELNTALDESGEPRDVPARPPVELCEDPTRMKIAGGRAYISCFQAASVFVVDLASFRVVDTVVTGTGPNDLVVDEVRGILYVANTLEASISVIDIREDSRNQFKELARIGLQEPFSQ